MLGIYISPKDENIINTLKGIKANPFKYLKCADIIEDQSIFIVSEVKDNMVKLLDCLDTKIIIIDLVHDLMVYDFGIFVGSGEVILEEFIPFDYKI